LAPFFARLASKLKSTNMTLKQIFFKKSKRYQKTQNFTLISNPLKKFKKKFTKKVISKNVTQTLKPNAQKTANKNGKPFFTNMS
jgi:hypothetical protein